jgi:hypothetical protein
MHGCRQFGRYLLLCSNLQLLICRAWHVRHQCQMLQLLWHAANQHCLLHLLGCRRGHAANQHCRLHLLGCLLGHAAKLDCLLHLLGCRRGHAAM